MLLQAKKPRRLPAHHQKAGREACNKFSLRGLRRNQPCPHLDLGLPASRTEREQISVVSATQFVIAALKTIDPVFTTEETVAEKGRVS